MPKVKTNPKTLSKADAEAAQRCYAIYVERKKEAKIAVRAFMESNPGLPVPDYLNVSQRSLAERVGWSQGNFSQYLSGSVPIRESALEKICEALDCNPWDIRPEKYSVLPSDKSLVEAKSLELLTDLVDKIVSGDHVEGIPERVKLILNGFIEEEAQKISDKRFEKIIERNVTREGKVEKENQNKIKALTSDFARFKRELAKFENDLNGLMEKNI